MIIDDKNKDALAPDDDLEIVVEGKPKPRPKPEEDDGDDAIAALQKTVKEGEARSQKAEAERQTALRERDDARARARAAVNERVQADEASITSAIAAWQTDIASLNKEYRAALEANDLDKATEVNDKLVEARIELRVKTSQKADLEAWKVDQVKKAEAAERNPQSQDPLAVYTDRTRQWIEAHTDSSGKPLFLADQRFQQRATGAHNLALADGLQPDTDAYFDFVERTMGLKQDAVDDGEVDDVPAPARTARPSVASTAAPPSRGNGNGASRATVNGRQTIKLTQAQRDLAVTLTSLGDTEQERLKNYAINLQRIQQEAKGNA